VQELGFIGLGEMGAPMATRLAQRFRVKAYSRSTRTPPPSSPSELQIVDSPAELAGVSALFLCLPDADAVNEVLFGRDNLASTLPSTTIVVDTGTSDHTQTLTLAEKLGDLGITFIDAPVSGMRARAEDGSLTIMCGGNTEAFERVRPALAAMASSVIHMGPVGSGQLTKLVNQLLFDINAAALAEILPFAVKLGLNPTKVAAVVNGGTGRSYASEFFAPRILKGHFSDGYPMAAAYKDLVSAAEIASRRTVPLPVLSAAMATYQQTLLAGHGDKDKGGMIRVFEDMLNVSFRARDGELT